jgi:rsbT co-antagonist protein RsbR
MQFIQTLLTIHGDPDIQRRGRTVVTVALSLTVFIVAALPIIVVRPEPLQSMLAVAVGSAIITTSVMLARRGQVELAGWILVVASAVTVILPTIMRRDITSSIFYLIIPLLIAGVVLRPWQVWLALLLAYGLLATSAVTLPAELLMNTEGSVLYSNAVLIFLVVALISFVSARNVRAAFTALAEAQQLAQQAAQRLEEANSGLEGQVATRTAELRSILTEMEQRAEERQCLIEEIAQQALTIREMSIPILPVTHNTLVMPLIGALDSKRLADIQSQALGAVERYRARTLLLDVTGVPIIDTHVARALLTTIQATRLLGTETKLIGVRPEVAQSIVSLGIDLHDVKTAADLERALRTV